MLITSNVHTNIMYFSQKYIPTLYITLQVKNPLILNNIQSFLENNSNNYKITYRAAINFQFNKFILINYLLCLLNFLSILNVLMLIVFRILNYKFYIIL